MTAATSSTSTGAPDGSVRTPTALRATAPRSPSRSRSTEEAPSATAEWAVKPSTAAMNTVILSARSMPASPTASTSAVTALSAASPAASRAAAMSRSRPTTPWTTSSPCRRGVIPAVQASPPCTTAGT